DAALRGIRTALVDKGDFGGGTSSHSSRLIHGGLRYLEQGAFRLVFEASRERRVLLTIAPHLVRPLAFLFPVYRGARVPAWRLRAGLWLYDLLAAFRNVRPHRWLGRKAVLRLEAGLRERDLQGAGLYYDAQADDARLVIATMRSAAQAGALVANYAEVSSLLKPDGRVRGATVRDALTGATCTVRALVVVNATGPWLDRVRRLDDPRAEPLVRPTKGTHVVVLRQRLGNAHAVTLTSPIDGRVMFILPWGGDQSYIGTTDTDEAVSPDDVRASPEDVTYLLRSATAGWAGRSSPGARRSGRKWCTESSARWRCGSPTCSSGGCICSTRRGAMPPASPRPSRQEWPTCSAGTRGVSPWNWRTTALSRIARAASCARCHNPTRNRVDACQPPGAPVLSSPRHKGFGHRVLPRRST